MELMSLRVLTSDRDLLRVAAAREAISQSEFLRKAIRDRAQKVLLADQRSS